MKRIVESVLCQLPSRSFLSKLCPPALNSFLEAAKQQPEAPPPVPETVTLGRQTVVDPYSWLSNHQAAKPFLRQEEARFRRAVKQLRPLAQELLVELRQHVAAYQVDDPPEAVGPYCYQTHFTPQGTQTITRTSSQGGCEATPQLVVSDAVLQADLAAVAASSGLRQPLEGAALADLKLSQCQQLAAYGVTTDSEGQVCIVRDLASGAVLGHLPAVTSFEWSADNSCIYYTTADASGRPDKVYRHSMSPQPAADTLLFYEPDPKCFITLTRTKGWCYVLINSTSKLSSEVHLLDAHDPHAAPRCVQQRQPQLEYFVEHQSGHLLILSNHCPQGLHNHISPRLQGQQQGQHMAATQSQGLHEYSPLGLHGQQLQHTAGTQAEAAPGSHQQGSSRPASAAAATPTLDSPAGDYSLYAVPVEAVLGGNSLQHWQLLLQELPGLAITDLDVFEGAVVLHTLRNSLPQLLLLSTSTSQQQLSVKAQQQVQLPAWVLWMRPGINSDYHSSTFRLYASNPAHPELPMQLHLPTGTLRALDDSSTTAPHTHAGAQEQLGDSRLRQQDPQQQQHNQQQQQLLQLQQEQQGVQQQQEQQHAWHTRSFQRQFRGLRSERLWATAPDGTQVPLTLLQQAGQASGRPRPLLCEVYGAYGHVLEAEFKPHRLTLLNRGWAVALAHVRGGGELGRRWHAGGRQLLKHNSVSDLLAVLQHLMDLGVTAPGLIAGHAASAGGLTLAAAINARPHWFSAAVLEAPYVDWVAGTGAVGHNGKALVGEHMLTEHEVDEWGDPWTDPAVAQLIRDMCPYSNLRVGVRYPAMLLTAGLEDSRVPWWMAAKYVAKLHSMQDSGSTGSSGSSGDGVGGGSSSSSSWVATEASSGSAAAPARPHEVLLQVAEVGGHLSIGLAGGDLQQAALQQAFMCAHTPGGWT